MKFLAKISCCAGAIGIALLLPMHAAAQLIEVRTVPIATAGQFVIFPSQNFGLANVSIALNDPLLDPFINPAKGARVRGFGLCVSPGFTNATENSGLSRSLPMSMLFRAGRTFAGASLTLQQVGAPERPWGWQPLNDDTENMYAFGMFGRQFGKSGISIAASMQWASLQGINGVDMLYASSDRVEQNGHIVDMRLGFLQEGATDGAASLEAMLLYNRVSMLQKVYYSWEDSEAGPVRNEDKTHTWGLHLAAMQPVPDIDGNVGLSFTMNYKTHPKIPNYELMNLPRDPGYTWAFNLGAGIASHHDGTTLAVDFIFEPIWSYTWAEAATPQHSWSGKLIPAGGKTVENTFVFTNWAIRLGLSEQGKVAGFQLGVQVRRMVYDFTQRNNIAEIQRLQRESWFEWYPSFSIFMNVSRMQIRYAVRLTTGTGRPGLARSRWGVTAENAFSKDFLVAPAGALALQEAFITTHQITVSVALGE